MHVRIKKRSLFERTTTTALGIMLEHLPDGVLDRIVSYLPIKERCRVMNRISQCLHQAVNRSMTSASFFMENLDDLPEAAMKNFLDVYGTKIKRVNLDLFRSTHYYESSQWMWRQSVTNIAHSCPNLYELDLMICNRHKIRDLDLENIFKKCHNLRSLKIDAHFLNGHCFKKAPPLERLEMEMCVRINDQALQAICYRLKSLCALHVSQLLILNDKNLAKLVNSLKSLRELAIISHPNTKYEGLTGYGLSVIENLPLKTLLIDGLSAATDQLLGSISRVNENKISKTLENLSIAFCFNIGIHGLKRLAALPNLKNINLDGFKKRDVSLGIEELAASGHLVRLLLAEETNISAESLVKIVEKSPNLRLLDLTNNSQALSAEAAEKWITLCEASKRPPLYVLTSDHLMWNDVHRPQTDEYGRMSVQILHSCPQMINPEEISPSTALSFESPFSLPKGILLAGLRSGNRYRLLFQHLGHTLPSKVLQKDVTSPLAHIVAKREEIKPQAEFAPILPPASNYDPFSSTPDENLYNFHPFVSTTPFSITDQPIDYSMDVHNQPIFNNPHLTHFSPDVLRLLLNTHAYEDGALVGNDFAKEGILFREDGTTNVPFLSHPPSNTFHDLLSDDLPRAIFSPIWGPTTNNF
ncbi:unnamed protein product, partial [Mesorhabditis belari]|uniref:F-box domain-containing protein n=1 Tax=Mesorhabditis belari TaxID=2138241 RepID=A0AAF3ED99_9BILA